MGRPHGREGAFAVVESTERLELLEPGRKVRVDGREVAVVWRGGTAERPLLKLEGAEGREAIEKLRDAPITVARSVLGPLALGEFLVDDLIGCEAVDGTRRIGLVRDVLLLPSADLLEVEREGQEALLVPLIADAVRSVDLESRRVEVDSGFVNAD